MSFIQLLLTPNAGPSHFVKVDVPAHPKEKSVKVKIASAINIFNHLLIGTTPDRIRRLKDKTLYRLGRLKYNH